MRGCSIANPSRARLAGPRAWHRLCRHGRPGPPRAPGIAAAACLVLGLAAPPAQAYVFTIAPGGSRLYLQVGVGTRNADNATVNTVSVTVPALAVGNGTPQAMTSNSTFANSFFNGAAVCTPPQQVYIGAFLRAPGGRTRTATLSVTTPASLTSGADTLAFSSISWVSTANGDPTPHIPSGTFTGGTQFLRAITQNTWVENCLVFSYANAALIASGTYTGRAVYTLAAP